MGIVLFVDVDETLVYSRRQEENHLDLPGDKAIMGNTRMYVSAPRPGAKEFLTTLSALGHPMYALTNGLTGFQERVLEAHGLRPYVLGVIGRDEYHRVPASDKCLLIDDADPTSANSIGKLEAMGKLRSQDDFPNEKFMDQVSEVASRCFFQIMKWRGHDGDDVLARSLPEILARINSL